MESKLIAYALDFTSFLVQKTAQLDHISSIILFGSVARREAHRDSDVDIFIDVEDEKTAKEEDFNHLLDLFYKSTKYKNYWQPLGIQNPIKLVVGKVREWKSLYPSIIANGIILYAKYKPQIAEGKHSTFLVWENVKPNSKRVLLNKQLLGYKHYEKFYPGLLQKNNAQKLGKGIIIVPLEYADIFLKLFRKYKVAVKIKKVLEYS